MQVRAITKLQYFHLKRVHKVISFSVLTCIQQSVMNLGILMVQGLVNSFGTVVMAAFAAAVKIDAFAYMPVQDFWECIFYFYCSKLWCKRKNAYSIRIKISSLSFYGILYNYFNYCMYFLLKI